MADMFVAASEAVGAELSVEGKSVLIYRRRGRASGG